MSQCYPTLEVSIYFETPDGGFEATAEWPVPKCHAELVSSITMTLAHVEDSKHPGLRDRVVSFFSVMASTRIRYGPGAQKAAEEAVRNNVLPSVRVKWDAVPIGDTPNQWRDRGS